MDRRKFLTNTSSALSLSALVPFLITSKEAKALDKLLGDNDGYSDYPGYNGKLKYKSIWTNRPQGGKAAATLLWADNGVVIPPHIHPDGEFIYVIEGSLVIDATAPCGERTEIRYIKGESIWVPANSIHHNELSEGVRVLVFEPTPFVKI